MAMRYYDDAIATKIGSWVSDPNIKVLKPDETKRLLEIVEDETNDAPVSLPLITISRDPNLDLQMNVRNSMSFCGYKLTSSEKILTLDAVPVNLSYQLDIYTKHYDQGDEFLRNFVFGIINNSKLTVYIPYNGVKLEHVAHMRLLPNIVDGSDISERLFPGQFTRWTMTIEIEDAYFFNVPAHKAGKVENSALEVALENQEYTEEAIETIPLVKESTQEV